MKKITVLLIAALLSALLMSSNTKTQFKGETCYLVMYNIAQEADNPLDPASPYKMLMLNSFPNCDCDKIGYAAKLLNEEFDRADQDFKYSVYKH